MFSEGGKSRIIRRITKLDTAVSKQESDLNILNTTAKYVELSSGQNGKAP